MKTKPSGHGAAPKKQASSTIRGIRIRDLTREGEGIGSLQDGRVVFVVGAVPGDVATIETFGARKGILRARLVALEKKSPDRTEPPCPYFSSCGGCLLMNIEYQRQMKIKSRLAPEALKRIGGLGEIPMTSIDGPADCRLGYRNKGVFRLRRAHSDGRPIVGMYSGGTKNIVEIGSCLIQSPGNNRSLELLRERVMQIHRSGSDAENQALDALDEVTFRHAAGGDSMIVLGFRDDACSRDSEGRFVENQSRPGPLRKKPSIGKSQAILGKSLVGGAFEGIGSIWCGVTRTEAAGIDPYTAVHLRGAQRIRETVGKSVFRIGPSSFFQINTAMAEVLVETVRKACGGKPGGELLDLYCGAGLFSICLADSFDKVIGIESSRSAIGEAVANAEANSVGNATFVCGNAAEALDEIAKVREARENLSEPAELTILLDPPRTGCGQAVASSMTRLGAQRIIYVSCDPATLARDGALLGANGYRLKEVSGIDMFPQTMHMETVAVFEKSEGDK